MEALRKRREKIKGQEVVSDNFTAQEVSNNQDDHPAENFGLEGKKKKKEEEEEFIVESPEETTNEMDPLECALQNFQASRVMDDVVTEISMEDDVDHLKSALEKYKNSGRVMIDEVENEDINSSVDTEENYLDAYEEYSKSVVFATDSTVPTGTVFSTSHAETYVSGMKVKVKTGLTQSSSSRNLEDLRFEEIDSDCADDILTDLQLVNEKLLEGKTERAVM